MSAWVVLVRKGLFSNVKHWKKFTSFEDATNYFTSITTTELSNLASKLNHAQKREVATTIHLMGEDVQINLIKLNRDLDMTRLQSPADWLEFFYDVNSQAEVVDSWFDHCKIKKAQELLRQNDDSLKGVTTPPPLNNPFASNTIDPTMRQTESDYPNLPPSNAFVDQPFMKSSKNYDPDKKESDLSHKLAMKGIFLDE